MPKIAIIKNVGGDDCPNCGYQVSIVRNITDFVDVTDEELRLLKLSSLEYRYTSKAFCIIEMPDNQEQFVKKTVADYLKEEMVRAEKEALDKKVKEEKKRKSDLAKLAKSVEQKKALLEQLKQELGDIDG